MNEINIDESDALQCPYCNHLVSDGESDFSPCTHTVYIASVEGFEYLADNIALNKNKYNSNSCINDMTDALTAKSTGESIKYILDSASGM